MDIIGRPYVGTDIAGAYFTRLAFYSRGQPRAARCEQFEALLLAAGSADNMEAGVAGSRLSNLVWPLGAGWHSGCRG